MHTTDYALASAATAAAATGVIWSIWSTVGPLFAHFVALFGQIH